MKKISIFLLAILLSFPTYSKEKKKKQTGLEKAKTEADVQFSYTAGYLLTMYLHMMGENMTETLRNYFDAESFAKGVSDSLFDKEMEVDIEEMSEKFYTLYQELQKEKKQKNKKENPEEIAKILKHPDFAHMEKLDDNMRYEVIDSGTGKLLPKDGTFLVNTKLMTSTGRVIGEMENEMNYYSLDSSMSQVFEQARIGYHCRAVYTSKEILEDDDFEEGELPVYILDLEVTGATESYDEDGEDEYEISEEEKRIKYLEELGEIFQRPEFADMEKIGDEACYKIINPGEGEIIPPNEYFLYRLRTTSSTGRLRYESDENAETKCNNYSSPLTDILQEARVGMHFKLVEGSDLTFLFEEGELPIYIYEFEILGLP